MSRSLSVLVGSVPAPPTGTDYPRILAEVGSGADTAGRVLTVAGAVTAPLAPFTLGTQVGVPTGTTLTATTGMPAPDSTESITLTNPVTGASRTFTASVWSNRQWATEVYPNPALGATYVFRNCRFTTASIDYVNNTADLLWPRVVFDHCDFDGGMAQDYAVSGNYLWLQSCHVTGGADGITGATYTTVIDSNLIATTNINNADPHSDGLQNMGDGHVIVYHCWADGSAYPSASSALRIGSEFGACTHIRFYYTGMVDGGYTMQLDGSKGGNAGITDVEVVGCRWSAANEWYGPTDFMVVSGLTWTDNAYLDGTPINQPGA